MSDVTLPLGLDVGTTRIRLALVRKSRAGACRLAAVAARDVQPDPDANPGHPQNEFLAAVIDDLRHELGVKERRCVSALSSGVATLRIVRFPAMGSLERRRAARFEAERFTPWISEGAPCVVRCHPYERGENLHVVGVARSDALNALLACVKLAGLRPVGIDHEVCAWRRAFPSTDAVLDIGHQRATLHAFLGTSPLSLHIPGGGAEITQAIASDLSIAPARAEQRKRILGTAGAGERTRAGFVGRVAAAIGAARLRAPVARLALTGNACRLPGLGAAIEDAAQVRAEIPVSDLLRDGAYPDDVVRSAAPDWVLAAALGCWAAR